MLTATRAANAYRRVESESRSPLELVVMLYDGAVRFLNEARDAEARGDLRARCNAVSRVMAITAELQNTLDFERGGDIADRLDTLYTYIHSRLIDITLKKDVAAIEEVLELFSTMRDAWSQIATQPAMPAAS